MNKYRFGGIVTANGAGHQLGASGKLHKCTSDPEDISKFWMEVCRGHIDPETVCAETDGVVSAARMACAMLSEFGLDSGAFGEAMFALYEAIDRLNAEEEK